MHVGVNRGEQITMQIRANVSASAVVAYATKPFVHEPFSHNLNARIVINELSTAPKPLHPSGAVPHLIQALPNFIINSAKGPKPAWLANLQNSLDPPIVRLF